MREFISEDDLSTFEGWLKSQAIDPAAATPDELADWRSLFDEVRKNSLATPKVGLMKLRPLVQGEHRYAVAVREDSDLWLTLWVQRSPKGEFFVLIPRSDQGWDPHASYHLNGTLHQKSFDHKFASQKRQPLTGAFRGTEHLGAYAGHGPKGVGAICDPTAFSEAKKRSNTMHREAKTPVPRRTPVPPQMNKPRRTVSKTINKFCGTTPIATSLHAGRTKPIYLQL